VSAPTLEQSFYETFDLSTDNGLIYMLEHRAGVCRKKLHSHKF